MSSSTANGVLIGLLSSFGSAILIALVFIIVYFFKYTSGGRILLDRLGRPGEFDDEQAFLREEAEALETMEEGARLDYLRAKGEDYLVAVEEMKEEWKREEQMANIRQRSSKSTRQTHYPPTSRSPNTSLSKKKASRHGNSSPNLKSQTALCKGALKSNSSTQNAAS